jgi:hypothetical protein
LRHKDVSHSRTQIWAPWRFNLGDHWATVNYLLTRSFVLREEMLLSRWQHGVDCSVRFNEILSLIAGPERSSVVLVDEPGLHEPDGFDVWAAPSWPTIKTWNPSDYKKWKIVYQLDGISSAESKNPSPEDEKEIVSLLNRHGRATRVGKEMSLARVVEEMSTAEIFVGVDSGMSHVAHSVGVPMILVEYGLPIATTHRGKPFKHVRGTEELKAAVLKAMYDI